MILYVFGYALVFLRFSAQAKDCGGNLEDDNGTLEIEPSAWPCLWVISLQNRTDLRLELSPSMEESILVIPEQQNFSNLDHVESFWIKGSEKVSHTFKGKVLAFLAPSHYGKITLNWIGLTVDHTPVTLSRKFITDSEGSLDWEHKIDGTDKLFWAFDHRTDGNLNWTLDTVLPACDVEDPCDSIAFAVLQIMLDGNISKIEKTCDGSSAGSFNLTNTSKLLLILHINSVVAARTNLQVTWRQKQESDNVQLGYFFYPGSGFLKIANRFYVGNTIKISLRIKPRYPSGLILALHGKKHYIVLQMLNGTVKFTAENGNGPFSSTFTPAGTLDLCDGKWHTIEATKTVNMVTLGVDGQFATAGLGSLICTASDTEHPFYLGGQPNSSAVGVETNEQFMGCIKDFFIHGREAFIFPSFYESIHGGVPVQRCPVDSTEVEANVEIQATTLKELVTIEDCQEPIGRSPAIRTIVAPEGDAVEMQCVVHGIPLPEITWTRENSSLASNRVVVENNGTILRIKNARLNDEGSYVCVAANGVGTPVTQSVRLEVYGEAEQCSRIIKSDIGSLAMKTLSTGCLWVIELQNKTGFRLDMDPPMTEPILVIPEPSPSNTNVQSIQLSGAENASNEFNGKSLAVLVPSGHERTTLSWTGLHLDGSRVSSSAKLVEEMEGSLEWESMGDEIDDVFWVFDHEFIEELNWTLNTASTARNQENPCENISFSVLQITPDGNIREIRKTCDGSSEGSFIFEVSSKLLVLLRIKSSESARSKLQVSWRNLDEPFKKKVDGIVAGTDRSGAVVVPLNSRQTQSVASGRIYGLTFDWYSRRIYYLKNGVGIMRSNLDGSESKILLSDSSSFSGMTIEPTSRNLYIGNRSSRTIRVCCIDANKCSTVVNSRDLSSVEDIALHRVKGLLFWSLWRGNLFRSNLDGSNTTTILRDHNVAGIDVDELEDRLYWSLPNGGIGSCDLNGQDIRMLPNVNTQTSEVAINNDNVYYAGYHTENIHVISKSGTNEKLIANLTSATWTIALFGPEVSNQPANPCKKSKCAHLCVLITRLSFRCMCPENQKLGLDGKTCSL